MKNFIANWGATFPLTVTTDKEGADTATLIIGKIGEPEVLTKTSGFSNNSADLTLTPMEMEITPDTYKYQVNVEYDDGSIDKFPNPSSCSSDHDLPDFTVVETLDTPSGS